MLVRYLKVFFLLQILQAEAQGYSTRSVYQNQYTGVASSWYNNKSNAGKLKTVQPNVKLRHGGHSKFPHLDGVMSRLNKYKTTTKSPLLSRYSRKKKDEYYDNYEEVDDYKNEDVDDEMDKDEDDMTPDYDSWGNDDEEKNDEEDPWEEEDVDDDKDDNYQAEEATQEPSEITQYKWSQYGTRSRVEESRRYQMSHEGLSGADNKVSVVEHIRRVNMEAKCKTPKLRVINVQNEHPSPGKRYLPHCTTLFRCSDDTGCCTTPDTKCQPKKQVLVHLYFYSYTMARSNELEKLSFYNHTECSCLKIGTAPVDVAPPPENLRSARSGVSVRAANSLYGANAISCNCPEEYVSKRRYDAKCVCDCSSSNMDCINMKRGKEHFSLKDRKCILDEKCGIPSCEYGSYLKNRGRCPRKQEKLDAYANVSTSRTPY